MERRSLLRGLLMAPAAIAAPAIADAVDIVVTKHPKIVDSLSTTDKEMQLLKWGYTITWQADMGDVVLSPWRSMSVRLAKPGIPELRQGVRWLPDVETHVDPRTALIEWAWKQCAGKVVFGPDTPRFS